MITIFKTNSMKNASDYVMNVLKQVDKTNLSVMRTIIVPDRASLEAERALLTSVGGSFNIQVRTFRRLANEILPKFNYLSKQAGVMALAGIIRDCKSRFICYTKGVETSGFVADMYDTISMMKYCRVSPNMLEAPDLPKSVAAKAHDIAILYREYLNYTENRFIDSADKLELLCQNLSTSATVTNGYFYLFDFDNFSAQELALVEQLILCSRGVTVACCASDDKKDKFLYLNDIFDGVMSVCKRNGIEPNIVERMSFTNPITETIGKHLFRYDDVLPTESRDFVEVYRGATRYREVYALGCRVRRYVRDGGRFRDIYAVTSDVSKYSDAIATVFDELEIPYFCDRQFNLADHPYVQYIADYINIFRNNGKLDFVLRFVKNYMFCGKFDGSGKQNDNVFLFENYCLKYNISYDFRNFELGKNEPLFAGAESFRKIFADLCSDVVFPQNASAAEYVSLIEKLIQKSNLNEKIASFSREQADMGLAFESKVTVQVQQKFQEVLEQAKIILGEREMTLDEFSGLLSVAVSEVKISVIPVSNDCVVFANMAKARKHDIKFLALLGANFGAMPIVKSDCKLLSDSNLRDLENADIKIEPQIFIENRRERFSLFQLLQEPTQKLYISFTVSDGADTLSPSAFVGEMSRLFTAFGKPLEPSDVDDVEVYTEKQAIAQVILNSRKLKDNRQVKMPSFVMLSQKYADKVRKFEFTFDGKVTVENGKKFYLSQMQTSVSKITDFYKCPYKFYFEYGLHIRPRDVAELQAADLGNILHDVLEHYVRKMSENEDDNTTREIALQCFENAVSDDYYKGMRNDIRLYGTLKQLQDESVRMCLVVKRQFTFSDFRKFRTELCFGNNADIPPVEVDYGGGKFLLVGKIDRLDICGSEQKNDAKFIVIDYKSGGGAATYNEKFLYNGQKLQLLVYVNAVQNYFGYTPAGFYYFAMHDTFANSDKETYVYNGRTLCDVDVACALDRNLKDSGKSEKLNLKLTKKGELAKSNYLLSENQMRSQVEYALLMIARAGMLMQNGYADVSPYKGSCDYCDYKDICDFNDVLVREPRQSRETVGKTTVENIMDSLQNHE